MTDKPWKKWERLCAEVISGSRYPFNSGGAVDVESEGIVGQCKEVQKLHLAEVVRLAVEIEAVAKKKGKEGVAFIRHKAGRGNYSPGVVVMTVETFEHFIKGGGSW
jgi:hypothetical protein